MSTILKALRRLEEDKPGKAKSAGAEGEANADAVSTAAAAPGAVDSDLAATTEAPPPARPAEARPPSRSAPTDPRATDELRERILAEERASEVARTDRSRANSRERDEAIAASASGSASIAETLTSAPDPFANRVVEPAFTPPSSATPRHTNTRIDSASPSSASAGASGLLSRGLMVAALGLGVVVVFLAGFLYSGQAGTNSGEASVALSEIADSPAALPPPPASRSAAVPAFPAATQVGAEPTRVAAQVASAATPAVESPTAPVRPMTVTRSKVAPRTDAPRQAAAPKPRPALRAAPAPAPEPAQAKPSSALARAAVRPTRAAREASRALIPQAPADPVVASRPRVQTFPADRARVAAAGPSKSSALTESIQVAASAQKPPGEQLPIAEVAPSRPVPALPEATSAARVVPATVPEATPPAGSVRPSHRPTAEIAKATSAVVPSVELVEHRGLLDLTVIRTSWHPTADRRSAKIRLEEKNELVTLREGDSVGGMVIHEISPSAVVFSAGEVQIRRRVGEAPSGR